MKVIVRRCHADRLLEMMTRWAREHRWLGSTLSIDSTHLDVRYQSRHYEQRCRHHAKAHHASADQRRSRSARRTPKLTLGVDTSSHFILSARPRAGMGSDAPQFEPILRDALRRHPRLRVVLADAGYDSHANHVLSREQLKVRSLIKAGIGRTTGKSLSSKYRRRMQWELAGSQKGRLYGHRAQSESANSMIKRNLGDHLRSRSLASRHRELFKVLTHNVMIIRRRKGRPRQSPPIPLAFSFPQSSVVLGYIVGRSAG